MNIEILGHNMKVSAALHEYARKKLERFDHYLPNLSEARVELSHEHTRRGDDVMTAQITLRHRRGAILRAQESTQGDIESALNEAIERMHRQIERFKGKRSPKGRERFTANAEELLGAIPVPGMIDPETDDETVVTVLRRKVVQVAAMHEDEAIEQMELLGHDFFIYYDERSGGINVAYKRRAGGYGILVPQLT
ncbi:MAG: ribosome-associated translation inhibitor RaiA [Chloroflexota bacterium]|nr:ribosome-associated translation inhibitor RaiA [Chloroflexota bacterium]